MLGVALLMVASLALAAPGDSSSEAMSDALVVSPESEPHGWSEQAPASASAEASSAAAQPPGAERWSTELRPPFSAWVGSAAVTVRSEARADSGALGVVRGGDSVVVAGCLPNCAAEKGWARLSPFGFVPLSAIRTSAEGSDRLRQATFVRFQYGRITRPRALVRDAPDVRGNVVAQFPRGFVLAFAADDAPGLSRMPDANVSRWLQRPSGGYIAKEDVALFRPSDFSGVHHPQATLAIALSDIKLGEGRSIARHEAVAALGLDGKGRVRTPFGPVPRSLVRLAFARKRPHAIPPDKAWVHVDLNEQVLTAYEGDEWIFATLISSGQRKRPTLPGVFRVQEKIAHRAMSRSQYYVDEVPFILYFNQSQAFHGAFWHDSFGTAVSHGCVNLSLTDAAWLFAWAKPDLPPGWQSVETAAAHLSALWVQVESAPLGNFSPEAELLPLSSLRR